MSARLDLMATATALATQARRNAGDGNSLTGAEVAAGLARGAKAALEAAALVDAEPAPLVAALERLEKRLGEFGAPLTQALDMAGPAEALDVVGDMLERALADVAIAAAIQHGYASLRDLLTSLERDFSASDTPTAQRIAARIHLGLEDAAGAIQAAQPPKDGTHGQ